MLGCVHSLQATQNAQMQGFLTMLSIISRDDQLSIIHKDERGRLIRKKWIVNRQITES